MTKQIGNFRETSEKIVATLNGWDGKSYDGEGRTFKVWVNPYLPNKKFVKAGGGSYRSFHEVLDEKHEKSGLPTAICEYLISEIV